MLQMVRNAVPATVRQRLREPVKGWLRLLRRKLGLSPIQRVCAELERRGVILSGRRTDAIHWRCSATMATCTPRTTRPT